MITGRASNTARLAVTSPAGPRVISIFGQTRMDGLPGDVWRILHTGPGQRRIQYQVVLRPCRGLVSFKPGPGFNTTRAPNQPQTVPHNFLHWQHRLNVSRRRFAASHNETWPPIPHTHCRRPSDRFRSRPSQRVLVETASSALLHRVAPRWPNLQPIALHYLP
jgi:hypothetical protein